MPSLVCRFQVVSLSIRMLGILIFLLLVTACGRNDIQLVKLDGSSTVFPISEAMAEEYQKLHSDVRVTVGISGTGGGFKKFCRNETDINDASRPIKAVEEETCSANDVDFIELPIAFDGLSVLVHPENDWVDFLTVDELKQIWEPGSSIMRWSDVRGGWPDVDIVLVGADTDSGTFDYFTKAIIGEEGASRPDYVASADDNVLVQAVSDSKYALGYFGYAFYAENRDILKVVPIDPGDGVPVKPSLETVRNGVYRPLSRPILIYINQTSLETNPRVREFTKFYIDEDNGVMVEDVGYVRLRQQDYQIVNLRFDKGITGTVFGGGSTVGVTLDQLLDESDNNTDDE